MRPLRAGDFPEGARFCGYCGEARKPEGPASPTCRAERKQATVLFADVAGSTERIAGLDAEGAMNFLHPIVMVMAACRTPLRGHRASHPGRRASRPRSECRTRARDTRCSPCHAALAMRAARRRTRLNAPPIRIGLHSGEVVSGKLDSGSSIEQDVTGLTVHLASRIEHEAPPGEICLRPRLPDPCFAPIATLGETLGPRPLR